MRIVQIVTCLLLVIAAIAGGRLAPNFSESMTGGKGCQYAYATGPGGEQRTVFAYCEAVDDEAVYRVGQRGYGNSGLLYDGSRDSPLVQDDIILEEIDDPTEAMHLFVVAHLMTLEDGWRSDLDINDSIAQEILHSEEGQAMLKKLSNS